MAMDKIYIPKTDLPTIHLGQRRDAYQNAIAEFPGLRAHLESPATALEWPGTATQFAQLEDSVSLDQLGDAADLRIRPYYPSVYRPDRLSPLDVPAKALATLRTLEGLVAQRKQQSRSQRMRMQKYSDYRHLPLRHQRQGNESILPSIAAHIEPGTEQLIVVRVYKPFKYVPRNQKLTMRMQMNQRITVLGNQLLTELRDRIYCECTSYGPFLDISANFEQTPDKVQTITQPALATPRSVSDPGFFFINDTFYTDDRHTASEAYTLPIREWARLHPDEVGAIDAQNRSMHATRFEQLRVRLGAPYVYQHHGNCEHVFTVSDVRLIATHGDSLVPGHYPLVDVVAPASKKSCHTCGMAEATVVVCDSVLHVHDPAFLCDECFIALHYVDGAKVGEFRAFKYVGNQDITKEWCGFNKGGVSA